MTIEDLHWADPTILELLLPIISEIERRRFIVATARPEFAPPCPATDISPPWSDSPDRREAETRVRITKGSGCRPRFDRHDPHGRRTALHRGADQDG
jgi:hypothetical protein